MRFSRLLILTVCLFFLWTCNSCKDHRVVHRGFYYWKTNVMISPYEQSFMDSLKSTLLYVRFFDVDATPDGKSIKPIAIAHFDKKITTQKIIPTVFITPKALNAIQWNTVDKDAQNIAALLEKKAGAIELLPGEIQIDCDWTANTKGIYFELLQALKRQPFFKDKILSVTIRMHQVKYRASAGMPPADKGILMVYNMDRLDDINVENSIFNESLAEDYLKNIGNYPLKLDVAFPIFSWSLLFENGILKGILRDWKPVFFEDKSLFEIKKMNQFLVLKDTVLNGYSLKKNQLIRYEYSDIKALSKISKFISRRLNKESLNILLYHCDAHNFKQYQIQDLERLFTDFSTY